MYFRGFGLGDVSSVPKANALWQVDSARLSQPMAARQLTQMIAPQGSAMRAVAQSSLQAAVDTGIQTCTQYVDGTPQLLADAAAQGIDRETLIRTCGTSPQTFVGAAQAQYGSGGAAGWLKNPWVLGGAALLGLAIVAKVVL